MGVVGVGVSLYIRMKGKKERCNMQKTAKHDKKQEKRKELQEIDCNYMAYFLCGKLKKKKKAPRDNFGKKLQKK